MFNMSSILYHGSHYEFALDQDCAIAMGQFAEKVQLSKKKEGAVPVYRNGAPPFIFCWAASREAARTVAVS
jgi:hypothetical protein